MSGTDIQIAICGSAGDGTIAAGGILNQAMARAGYKVIAFDVYPAEIRGFGECIACSRITSEQVFSLKAQSDVLVSLNDGHAIAHVPEVRAYGAVIYDDAPISTLKEGQHISGHIKPAQLPYGLPMREISERTTSAAKSRNMVALGYLAGLYGMPRAAFHDTIGGKFKGKAAAITEGNVKAFDAGYAEGEATFRLDFIELGPAPKSSGDAVMMSGNTGDRRRLPGCRRRDLLRLSDHAGDHDPRDAGGAPAQAGRAGAPDRGRDRGDLGGDRGGLRRRARGDRDLGAGSRADDRDDGAGRDGRGAGGGLRLAARRPVDRHADQDRAVGPQSRGLRRLGRRQAHRARADQRRGLLPLRRPRVRARREIPDAGDRAARPVSVEPARERRRARQDPLRAEPVEGLGGAGRGRGLSALRDHRRLDQPARRPGRARRHPHGHRPRAQRGRPAQGHARDPPADDREAAPEAGAGDPPRRPVRPASASATRARSTSG